MKKILKCYGCGKPGHIVKNYKSKSMVYLSQSNVMQKISTKKLNSKTNSPVLDENDFNQFLIKSGNIEEKMKDRIKQKSDNENDVEFQNIIETIKILIQHTDKMVKISTKYINRFYET